MSRCIAVITLIAAIFWPSVSIHADTSLELIASFRASRDSAVLGDAQSVGDFNADGFPDIALSARYIHSGFNAAFYIFYGGPDFDTIPDLVLRSEPQNSGSDCYAVGAWDTGFGGLILKLNDYNGDGYNDLAIPAHTYCTNWFEGRIYIYFGGPDPDTSVDLVIDGYFEQDELGYCMGQGDFNGDGLEDILALTCGMLPPLTDCYIYLGSTIPDSIFDWHYQTPDGTFYTNYEREGLDINGDGFDDFSLSYNYLEEYCVFLGGNPIGEQPWQISQDYNIRLCHDISGDSIDDVLLFSTAGCYLSLGGDSVDLEPDYYIGENGLLFAMTYEFGIQTKLILWNRPYSQIYMYRSGVPFDSNPEASFYVEGLGSTALLGNNLGDINDDGNDEFSIYYPTDDSIYHVSIYTIATTGIEDNDNGNPNLSEDALVVSAYPNPFNSSTSLYIDGVSQAEIDVFDITGRVISMLKAENGKAIWDASGFSSGIYFARVKDGEKTKSVKLILVK